MAFLSDNNGWARAALKLAWGGFLLLTSLYCLLAYLPYTYYALIQAPPYDWMPWFVRHHRLLFGASCVAAALAFWPKRNTLLYATGVGAQVVVGLCFVRWPLATVRNDWTAYALSLAALVPLLVLASLDLFTSRHDTTESRLLGFPPVALAGALVALVYAAATHLHLARTGARPASAADFALTAWSVLSHALLAVAVIAVLNLCFMAAAKTQRPGLSRRILIALLATAVLWAMLFRFLANSFSFRGVAAHAYAATVAAALVLVVSSITSTFAQERRTGAMGSSAAPIVIATACAVLAFAMPKLLGGGDWNGILYGTFTLLFWIVAGVCAYRVRLRAANYSLALVLGVLLISGIAYKGLQATAIFWAKPLGATDDEIARAFDKYAAADASFGLVHRLLGNAHAEPCGELCQILRQYTDIADARVKSDLLLVDQLTPATGYRPNIFIFVIDSLRPDYLGAYNPHVDFTPNLDRFARENLALHNAVTQYSGTTLSEPAIWAGAMLLHAHYLQPFDKINNLVRLAHTDGYQLVVSYDTVLRNILPPAPDITLLDSDKPLWNRFEVSSTVRQLENVLDSRPGHTRPVLFYAQPMNVHQFGQNDLPGLKADKSWRRRPGFDDRVAHEVHQVDEALGQFIAYLKSRGLYDDSIVIVTSDHGDATGEFGRTSHSTTIFPEIIRVPLLIHLPPALRGRVVFDDTRTSTLTDIAPSLYYLLGHRPIRRHPLLGRPLFAENLEELRRYERGDLLLASDVRAVYGMLDHDRRYLYVTYDSPAESFLFDLQADPNAEHNILTDARKQDYDRRIIRRLQDVAEFYDYRPKVGSMFAAAR